MISKINTAARVTTDRVVVTRAQTEYKPALPQPQEEPTTTAAGHSPPRSPPVSALAGHRAPTAERPAPRRGRRAPAGAQAETDTPHRPRTMRATRHPAVGGLGAVIVGRARPEPSPPMGAARAAGTQPSYGAQEGSGAPPNQTGSGTFTAMRPRATPSRRPAQHLGQPSRPCALLAPLARRVPPPATSVSCGTVSGEVGVVKQERTVWSPSTDPRGWPPACLAWARRQSSVSWLTRRAPPPRMRIMDMS